MSNQLMQLTEEDRTELAYILSQIALKTLHNKAIETSEYTLNVKIPVELVAVMEKLAEKSNQPLEELLGSLANRGLEMSLQLDMQKLQNVTKEVTSESNKDPTDQLNQLSGLMNQLGKFSEVLQQLGEATKHVDITTNKTNT